MSDPVADDLRRELAGVEVKLDSVEKRADVSHDRSRIAKLVIWLYVAVVSACFLYILGMFLVAGNWTKMCGTPLVVGCVVWKEPAEFLLQVLTTTVLPIVTLVLGYYFGTAKAEAAK